MKGIRLRHEARFAEVWQGLGNEMDDLFWLLDLQGGPFDCLTDPDWEKLEEELDAYVVDTGELEMGKVPAVSGSLWHPGVFPRFLPYLVEDEWSYLVGLDGPEPKALADAKALGVEGGYLSRDFFDLFQRTGRIFAVLPFRRWQVYSPDPDLLARVAEVFESDRLDSDIWENFPDNYPDDDA